MFFRKQKIINALTEDLIAANQRIRVLEGDINFYAQELGAAELSFEDLKLCYLNLQSDHAALLAEIKEQKAVKKKSSSKVKKSGKLKNKKTKSSGLQA